MRRSSALALRRALVADLERRGDIRTAAVRKAFLAVPRERFVPEIEARDGLARVYADQALVTRTGGGGAPTSSSSQPAMMAQMLEALDLRPGLRVLEIGTGTGYNAALLATLVGPRGHVTSVELQWDLADKASRALRDGGHAVEVLVGDAQHGRFGAGPYDRIILTASTDHVAPLWFEQLADGGLIEMPLRLGPPGPFHQLVVTFRREGDGLRSVTVLGGGFMFLRSAGDRGSDHRPATVSVEEVVGGKHRLFASLVGDGLEALAPEARRRLAGLLMTEPKVRALPTTGNPVRGLLAFVAMAADPPNAVLVGHHREDGFGVGVATVDGRSLALAAPAGENGCRLLSHGSGEATSLLRAEVARWRSAGSPTLADWSIGVSFGNQAPEAARVLRRRNCCLTVDWAPRVGP